MSEVVLSDCVKWSFAKTSPSVSSFLKWKVRAVLC